MRVGFIGLGKLGMPVALAMSIKGHDVVGYDIDEGRMQKQSYPYQEVGPNGEPTIEPILRESTLRFKSMMQVVEHSEILFVAVQTPHEEKYEGITRLPPERRDFDYEYLIDALSKISERVDRIGQNRIVVIISTVLPGTLRRYVLPILSPRVKICYNPSFIAMGTTMRDFLNPEFVLFGVKDVQAAAVAEEFYRTLHEKPFRRMSLESAELTKVIYNTYITWKVNLANTVGEICHKTPGADADDVMNALKQATDRLISPAYLSAGMGDGGACHPRDNIALSWLARQIDLSYDIWEPLMLCREKQTEWLAKLMAQEAREHGLPMVILGKAFKAGTNITTGSASILLKHILEEWGHRVAMYDPHVDGNGPPQFSPSVFHIGTKHPEFREFPFPERSVVLDPWRYIPDVPGVKVVRIGAA